MAKGPVAADTPAPDTQQPGPEPTSVVPEKLPSAIDTTDEGFGTPEPEEEEEVVNPNDVGEETPEGDKDETQELLNLYKEDHLAMNVIRNDPVAYKMLRDHFKGRTEEPASPPDETGDGGTVSDLAGLSQKIDKLFGSINQRLDNTEKFVKQEAMKSMFREFKIEHPIVTEKKVSVKMQELLRDERYQELPLERLLQFALSDLGMSEAQYRRRAPLIASETSGALERSTKEKDIQTKIDSQDSFDKSLDVALRETAAEQGFM